MKTIQPDAFTDDRAAYAVILNETGDPVGTAVVRASANVPGHVTLVASCELGNAIRIPANWIVALGNVQPAP